MGVSTIRYLPGLELPEKTVYNLNNSNGQITLFIKYDEYIEKILISESTTPEELSRALLTICGVDYNCDPKGYTLGLWTEQGSQLLGQLEPNRKETPYVLKLMEDVEPSNGIKERVEYLRRKVAAIDMDKVQCDGSLYVLHDSPKKYKNHYNISPETAEWLKSPTFNNWEFEDNELVHLIIHMYQELGIMEEFQISIDTLYNFVSKVRDHYNHNPFHNFKHGFCVTQMAYALLWKTGFISEITKLEKLVLITACLGHDLDHPGYNNAYQVNAKTDLAIIYNDQSPLENHHSAMLFSILKLESCNLLKNVGREHVSIVRKSIIRTIMATDMAKHGESVAAFNKINSSFSFQDQEHRAQLLCILIKCADISTEVRPPEIAGIFPNNIDVWVNRLLEEFFSQSDREKQEGLPFLPFMDRLKVTKAGAQTG
jgi:hypothetical protein